MIHTLAKFLVAPLVFVLGLAGYTVSPIDQVTVTAPVVDTNLGVALPSATAVFETSLSAPITSTATSMSLASNSIRGGQTLSGYNCFTIDEGTTQGEYVCGTVSGTSVTSLIRGISLTNGTSTIASLQFAHRRGANVKITDFPLIQLLKAQNNGEETYENPLVYASGVSNDPTATQEIASVGYVNNVSFQGVATSTESTGGIVELGTLAEQASSYDGGVNKPTVIQTKNSTSTCQVVGPYNIVASSTTGKIDKGCIDQTLDYTWGGDNSFSGSNTFNATTNFTATTTIVASDVNGDALVLNGLNYSFPDTRSASSTILMEDGNGNLSFQPTTQYLGTAYLGSISEGDYTSTALPAGTGLIYMYLEASGSGGCGTAKFGSGLLILTPGQGPQSLSYKIVGGCGTATVIMNTTASTTASVLGMTTAEDGSSIGGTSAIRAYFYR